MSICCKDSGEYLKISFVVAGEGLLAFFKGIGGCFRWFGKLIPRSHVIEDLLSFLVLFMSFTPGH